MSVVLLAAPVTTSRLVAGALAAEGLLAAIVVVARGQRLERLRLRARRRGPLGFASYAASSALSGALFRWRGGAERAAELIAAMGLRDEWPRGVPLRTVSAVNAPDCVAALRELAPRTIVVNGTNIIKPHVLAAVPATFVNVHTGLTPDYRGAHGGFWAIASGEPDRVGVTVHFLDEGVDTGRVIAQRTVAYDPKRDGLHTLPLVQYAAAIPLLIDFLRTGAAPGPVPGSRRSQSWRSPGIGAYLRVVLGAKLRH